MQVRYLIEAVARGANATHTLKRVLHESEQPDYYGRGEIDGKYIRFQVLNGIIRIFDMQHAGKRGRNVDVIVLSYNAFDYLDQKVQSNINKLIKALDHINFAQASKWVDVIKKDADLRQKTSGGGTLHVDRRAEKAFHIDPVGSARTDTIEGRENLLVKIDGNRITYRHAKDDDYWYLNPNTATTVRRKILNWILTHKQDIQKMSYTAFHEKMRELFKGAFDRSDVWR